MEDFMNRLHEEKEELEVKISALNEFFTKNSFEISHVEQDLLLLQYHIMKSYSMTLQRRIDYYDKAVSNDK